MKTEVLYEDEWVAVVYKPAGLATQTARMGEPDVVSELKNYLYRANPSPAGLSGGAAPYLGTIHRLDQPVEGLLVFAKNEKAAAVLSGQLQKQEGSSFSKRYYAVLCGQPAERKGKLINKLYRDNGGRAVIVEESSEEGNRFGARRAVLYYEILETCEGLALADIRIETGRFHQIRAQMAYSGTPIVGDRKYGNKESEEAAKRYHVRNTALCAYSLEFRHPVTKEKMSLQTQPRAEVFSFFSQL
ncbi:MAG: RluA family pseudouridine synthase [Lachnospiraceae bacterium]|nr:RluA family pseudouridine synthase [uncultured Acetatifactor sp.]MCI8286369.1 RluA family pseudouridine synthase [Lachnospiraceae bacterium]